jgi:hypothetical protein
MPNVPRRKRDRRTDARIARDWTERAASASRVAQKRRAKDRLRLLPILASMYASGLTLGDMARQLESRGVLTLTGKRYWYPTTVRNLLNFYQPFFKWFEMEDSSEARRYYKTHVQKLLAGKLLADYLAADESGEATPVLPDEAMPSGGTHWPLPWRQTRS